MKTVNTILCLVLGASSLAWAQDFRAAKPETPAPTPANSGTKGQGDEFTLGQQSVGNINELIKKVGVQNEAAKKRLAEIDSYVNPILGNIANELYGISPKEYLFLMKQSRARRSAMVFRRQRTADTQTPEGILEYFNNAYKALQAKELWFGAEESLVPQDAALFQMMKTDVLAAVAKRPDGEKIQSMLTERETLAGRLTTNLPLYNYLVQRRSWWESYPEYVQAVEEEAQNADNNPGTEGQPGFGNFGGGRFGGGTGGGRGGGRSR